MNSFPDFNLKTIIIYGVGLLGGSIAMGLKASGYKGKIIGISSEKTIYDALNLKCIDEGFNYSEFEKKAQIADCIFLCAPISVILDTIQKLKHIPLTKNCIITDVGSTKKQIMEQAEKYIPSDVYFIGGHPMAGSEKRGVMAADPYLFENAVYVLSPSKNTPEIVLNKFAYFLEKNLGCKHTIMDSQTHDIIAASVSHVPHLIAVALVNLVKKIDEKIPQTLSLAAGGFRDMTRIASSPYSLWHDILDTNQSQIIPIIDQFISELTNIKEKLIKNDLESCFNKARDIRASIPLSGKGFIRPLYDVFVIAADKVGTIAKIANACLENNINIKDIEVIKVRENQAGTIRLSFDTKEISAKVVKILKNLGFNAWEKE